MDIRQYNVKKSPMKNWNEIFQHPSPLLLKSFKTGTVNIQRRGTLNPKHPNATNITDEIIEVPIMAHWIHHEQLGDYLLDVGLDASYTDDPFGGVESNFADEFKQQKDENIGYYLDKYRIKLNRIFFSHLHADHIAGVRELPKNIPYVVGMGELEQYQPEVYGNFLKNVETIYEIDFKKLDKIEPLGHCADLLGDSSIWGIWTPGHTKGHTSFLINGLNGPILLAMDVCFIKDNINFKIAPSDYTWDVKLAQESLDTIIEFLNEFPQVKVVCGHEL